MPHFNFMTYTGHRFYKIKKLYGSTDGYILIFDSDFPTDIYTGYPLGLSEMKPYLTYLMESVGFFSQNANAEEYFTGKPGSILYWNVSVVGDTRIRIHPVFTNPLTKQVYDLDFKGNTGYDPQAACTYPFLIAVKYNNHYYPFIEADGYLLYSMATDWKYGLWYYADMTKKPSHTSYGSVTGVKLENPEQNRYAYGAYSDEWDAFYNYIEGNYDPLDRDDPNPGGGDSKPGGGGGDGDIGGDTNPDDGLPTISALDSGLLTAYNPTIAELYSLGRFLWSDSFDISTFKKLFNDPFDTLLGLSVVPVKPNTSGTKNIMFGNMDSGVSAPVVSNQWVSKDMGSVTLNEVWHGALDYAPSTGVTIYLPFIGMRQLNVNDVMGSTLHLIYKFDVLTGACVAQIYVNHNHQGNKDSGFSWHKDQGLLYEFIGQCSENIPLASQDFTNTIRAAISGVSVAGGAAASVATGNPALGITALTVGVANSGMQASTPTVERGGHLSGSASIMGYGRPFLIVERPHQCKPSRYYALRGVPSQVYTSKLSKCTGFTQITANNNLHIAGASDSELTELQNLLVSGVYFPDSKR